MLVGKRERSKKVYRLNLIHQMLILNNKKLINYNLNKNYEQFILNLSYI